MAQKNSAEKAVHDIRRKTRRKFSAEEKIRIVLEGLRGQVTDDYDKMVRLDLKFHNSG